MPTRKKSPGGPGGPDFEATWLRLTAWARRAGIDLHLRPQPSVALPYMRVASVSSRVGPQNRLYEALHEIGHILAADDVVTMKTLNGGDAGPPPRTYAHKAMRVAEEYDAWTRGWALSKRLRFGLDRRHYWRAASRALSTYARWSAEPHHRKET